MRYITFNYEYARKILSGLKGDKNDRAWAIDHLGGRLKEITRDMTIMKLAEEWVNQFVRNVQWNDPNFDELKNELMYDLRGDINDVISEQTSHLMDGLHNFFAWDEDTKTVVKNQFYHNTPYFHEDYVPEMLTYINEHIND